MVPEEGEWPDAGDESEYLSQAAARGETPAPAAQRGTSPVLGDKLPALDELVARVPPGVRALLDDLFRAKFTTVRRVAPDSQKA